MAHSGIFATKAEIDVKVGENVDTTGYTEANINAACLQAESYINVVTRYNWSDNFAGLNADVKYILSEAAACWVAIDFITYNMSAYTTRIEAEDMINVHWAKFNRLLAAIMDMKKQTFMDGA